MLTGLVLLLLAAWEGLLRDVRNLIGASSEASTLYFFGLLFVVALAPSLLRAREPPRAPRRLDDAGDRAARSRRQRRGARRSQWGAQRRRRGRTPPPSFRAPCSRRPCSRPPRGSATAR